MTNAFRRVKVLRVCIVIALATSAFAGYLHNGYGYGHGVTYSGLTGYGYAPAVRSFASSYHAAPIARVATYHAAPAVAAFAAPAVTGSSTHTVSTYHTAPTVATYTTSPAVAKVAAYHAAPALATFAHAPAYGYGYGLGHYGYGHGLASYGLNYGYGLGAFNHYKTLLHKCESFECNEKSVEIQVLPHKFDV
ncbi:cuticle protein 63-like [Ixodes scapularis]|uniref:cuticle protein 63-like n=1 Tax=Ixodes scapularis TaxID=6945 RepID=UPI001C3831EB|nr:cuticle protein 63-like [Ixodes scapularis]